ncbi:MAG: hypothetical protein JKY93_12665 [Gammaproteobacteria bacterium]|nr:hypothetical protein [Gammaproteobacteria bacterium]
MSALLNSDDLCAWLNCKQPAKLSGLLRERNISYHLDSKGKPCTTSDRVDASLQAANQEKVDF